MVSCTCSIVFIVLTNLLVLVSVIQFANNWIAWSVHPDLTNQYIPQPVNPTIQTPQFANDSINCTYHVANFSFDDTDVPEDFFINYPYPSNYTINCTYPIENNSTNYTYHVANNFSCTHIWLAPWLECETENPSTLHGLQCRLNELPHTWLTVVKILSAFAFIALVIAGIAACAICCSCCRNKIPAILMLVATAVACILMIITASIWITDGLSWGDAYAGFYIAWILIVLKLVIIFTGSVYMCIKGDLVVYESKGIEKVEYGCTGKRQGEQRLKGCLTPIPATNY